MVIGKIENRTGLMVLDRGGSVTTSRRDDMRILFAVSLFAAVVASPATSAPAPSESWGKTGVTYDQYRLDAFECSSEGYNFDISQTEGAQAFVYASRRLETEIG